jgi:predicted RNA binding protein YcfA (HicA-like mRNA interferase family)
MTKKLARLRADLKALGFSSRSGKGSHEIWTNPQQPQQRVVLYGRNGEDAHRYPAARLRKFRRGMMLYH